MNEGEKGESDSNKQYRGEEQLEMVEVPKPRAAVGEVVVRVVIRSTPIARRAKCARFSICSSLSPRVVIFPAWSTLPEQVLQLSRWRRRDRLLDGGRGVCRIHRN